MRLARSVALIAALALTTSACAGGAVPRSASTVVGNEATLVASPVRPGGSPISTGADDGALENSPALQSTVTRSGSLHATLDATVQRPKIEVDVDPALEGPGITDDTITIGIPYDPTAEARSEAAYGVFMERGRHDAWARIVARVLNRSGGIGGRKVKVRVFRANRRGFDSYDEYQRRECRYMARGNGVFAVFPELAHTDVAHECYAREGIAEIASFHLDANRHTLATYPTLYAVSAPDFDDNARTFVAALHRQGFFADSRGVGLVTYDDPRFETAIAESFVPALERSGVRLDRIALLEHPSGDPNKLYAQAASAADEFHAEGIDHVILFEGGAPSASGAFMFAAAKYNSFHYGISTSIFPGVEFDGGLTFLESELRRSTGIGWSPVMDLRGPTSEPYLTPTAKRWLSVFESKGFRFDRCCAVQSALDLVERFLFVQAAVERISGEALNAVTFRRAVADLGGSFRPLLGAATHFGPDRFAGASAYRDLAFSERCKCMGYRGPLRRFDF